MISLFPSSLPYWCKYREAWLWCAALVGMSAQGRTQPHLLLIKQFQACSATLIPPIRNEICVPTTHGKKTQMLLFFDEGRWDIVFSKAQEPLDFLKDDEVCSIAAPRTTFLEVKHLSHRLRLRGTLLWLRRLTVTCDRWLVLIRSLAFSPFQSPSLSQFPLLSIPSLHSQPYLWAWERNSGNIFPCETPSTSRGVWRHCIVLVGEKRNRARWGQILSTPKKQPLSHTGFLPRWTARNNPIVVGPEECERGISRTESKREAGLFLSVYADCLWAIENKQRGNTTHAPPRQPPTDTHTIKSERALYHRETTKPLGCWIFFSLKLSCCKNNENSLSWKTVGCSFSMFS